MVVAQGTRRSSHCHKKGEETASRETGSFNESPGGKGSEENSTAEYIKKLQAELAELKASQGMASASHTLSHKQRGKKGSNRFVPPRYAMRVLSQEVKHLHYFSECFGHLVCSAVQFEVKDFER
jgi:hypothetical protein